MAKPDLTQVYEALRVAEAEGRTDDVKKLIDYIDAVVAAPDTVAEEETYDPRELVSPTIPSAVSAAAGAVGPKIIESGIDQVKAGRAAAAAKPPVSSVTVEGVPSSALADIEEATTKGLSNEVTQQTRTAQRAARTEQMEKILAELKAKGVPVNPKILAEMEAQYARPGSGILIPVERAREIAAQEAATSKAAPKASLGQRAVSQWHNPTISSDIGNFAKGIYDFKLPFIGSVGPLLGRSLIGAGAGIQGTDAWNRAIKGDVPGSVISTIGAAGTAANLLPHPAFKAIGTGVGLSAEAINAYRDAMREGRIEHHAPESYDNINPAGDTYAQGGLVHLSGGGKPIPNPEDVQGTFSYAPGYYAEVADNIVPEGKTAGPNDAARHMLAAADLTRRIGNVPLVGKHIAGPVVKGLGYGHEIENYIRGKFGDRPQTREDMEQDLYNNALGIQLGQNAGSFQDIVDKIPGAVNVRPYRKEPGKAYIRNPQEVGTPYKPFGKFATGGLACLALGGQPPKPDANEGGAFIGYPQINKNRKIGSGTGFIDALVGAPQSRENILNPSDYSYMEGYKKGEPYGIASGVFQMGAPIAKGVMLAGTMARPTISQILTSLRNRGGVAESQRLERAADLVPNLEHQFQSQALERAFTGDNAQAVMVMNPKDFEKYAAPIDTGYKSSVMQTYGIGDPEKYGGYNAMPKGTYQDYIEYLGKFTRPGGGGLSDVPYLQLGQELNSSFPAVLGHEGRHRTAALEKLGDQSTLVRMMPRAALREPFPRRSQEEYLKALTEQIGQKPFVKPQKYMDDQGKDVRRGLIELPELFKKGGDV